jgi:ADP-ribose pyrophosphatase YjhB (NUDIX family)
MIEFEQDSFAPHITVACVVQKDNKFLLVEENAEKGIVFNQPAGHLEANETLMDAAKREAFEETGWHVELTAIIGIYFYTSPNNGITYHRICFAAEPKQFVEHHQLDEGIIRTHWFTYDELLQQSDKHRSPMVMQCINDYLSERRFPLDLIKHL